MFFVGLCARSLVIEPVRSVVGCVSVPERAARRASTRRRDATRWSAHAMLYISGPGQFHTYIHTPHTSIGREVSCEFTENKIILSLVGLYVRRSHLLLVPSEHLQGRVCMYVVYVCMYEEYYLFSDNLSVRSGTRTSARFRSAHTAAAASANCSPTVRWVMFIPINECMYVCMWTLHRFIALVRRRTIGRPCWTPASRPSRTCSCWVWRRPTRAHRYIYTYIHTRTH
jgi:hypothetical protein